MNPRNRLRPGWHWLLALLMLLSQQAALRHSLEHGAADVDHAAHSPCLTCLAFHAVDHAAPAAPAPALPLVGSAPASVPTAPESASTEPFPAFLARAPPLSLS